MYILYFLDFRFYVMQINNKKRMQVRKAPWNHSQITQQHHEYKTKTHTTLWDANSTRENA